MTYHDETFVRAPAHLLLVPEGDAASGTDIQLVVQGQGTVGFALDRMEPFAVEIAAGDVWGSPAIRWEVGFDAVTLRERAGGRWTELQTFDAPGIGVDPEQHCQYWVSVDCHNRATIYGKGEMRLGTALASHSFAPLTAGAGTTDPYAWLTGVAAVRVEPAVVHPTDVWRDPVTVEPALKILPTNEITMQQMAEGTATVAANLTRECQILYDNVAGDGFALDTPDFPEFSQAIEASILDPDGWCYKKLEEKANEFGVPNPDETYLRITLGINQGESPGVPFVMEIWPHGHYSPIHDHGGAAAVIKILHGEIDVSLYPMLSPHHETPFAEAPFRRGDARTGPTSTT
jgi:hypothetical protein